MASNLQIGDLVWAKMKSFPTWPGKIIEPKPDIKCPKNNKNNHFIFFFGSENYAWVPYDNVFSYIGNKEKFLLKTRIPKGFKEAVEAIEDAFKAMPEEAVAELQERLKRPETVPDHVNEKTPKEKGEKNDKGDKTTPKVDKADKVTPKVDKADKVTPKGEKGDKMTPKGEKGDKITPARKKRLLDKDMNDSASPKKTPKLKATLSPNVDSSVKKRLKPMKTLTPSEKILKKAKDTVKRSGPTPNIFSALSSPGSPAAAAASKNKPRKIAELRVSESDYTFNSDMGAPGAPLSCSSGTQIELEEGSEVKTSVKSVIPTPMRIGFLGLGIMGQGMVMNLLRSGHEVTVWNRTTQKCRDFVKAGALKGNSPCDVVQQCDITFCCVADTTAVKDIVFGSSGVLRGITTGKCFVEMSTIDEETVQDVAEAIQARGGVYLEAPVVGSRVPALEGQLTILASGDRKLFDDCFSCFEAIGKKSLYLGSDPGAATRMKLIINMVMGTVVASLAEGMAMAEKVGLDLEDVSEVLSIGSLRCPTIIHKSQAILNQKYDPHFPLQHQQKDLRLALQLGDKVEQPLYLAAAANELYKKARRLGYGESDISAVFRAASN